MRSRCRTSGGERVGRTSSSVCRSLSSGNSSASSRSTQPSTRSSSRSVIRPASSSCARSSLLGEVAHVRVADASVACEDGDRADTHAIQIHDRAVRVNRHRLTPAPGDGQILGLGLRVAAHDGHEAHARELASDPLHAVHLRLAVGAARDHERHHARAALLRADRHDPVPAHLAGRHLPGVLVAGRLLADVRVAPLVPGGARSREGRQRPPHLRAPQPLALVGQRLARTGGRRGP